MSICLLNVYNSEMYVIHLKTIGCIAIYLSNLIPLCFYRLSYGLVTFDNDNDSWATEYTQLKELLSPQEYRQANASVLDAFYTSPINLHQRRKQNEKEEKCDKTSSPNA